jgi:hypothetical protein
LFANNVEVVRPVVKLVFDLLERAGDVLQRIGGVACDGCQRGEGRERGFEVVIYDEPMLFAYVLDFVLYAKGLGGRRNREFKGLVTLSLCSLQFGLSGLVMRRCRSQLLLDVLNRR